MSVAPGDRIGGYHVLECLGAGGMGEVYRARDTRLHRDVALKALPERFARLPERLARFEREAHVLASLNHPNIAALYDVVQTPDHVPVLVLELVQGVTLADRIDAAPGQRGLPMDDVLQIARQVAAALEVAHQHGIVHRDLKPSNVAVSHDGTVKVLDFGLAKTLGFSSDPDGDTEKMVVGATTGSREAAGTPAYMSPEQARGMRIDQRADLWAFGCLVYEMVTGSRPFPGERRSDVVTHIINRDPDYARLPANTPAALDRLVRRCLEKRLDRRLRNAGDALLEIDDAINDPTPARTASGVQRRTERDVLVASAAACVGALTVAAMLWKPVVELPRTVLTISAPELARLNPDDADRFIAVAPDATAIAFAGNAGTQLFLRRLDERRPTPLTEPAATVRAPFFSPDGEWVGYVESNTSLRKVARSGGSPVTLVLMDGPSRGASWAPDGTILFATSNTATGLQRVTADGGGQPTVVTRPDAAAGELDHVFPHVLPGGRLALMTVVTLSNRIDEARIALVDLEDETWKTLVDGGYDARYVSSGHLVYISQGKLRAIAFDYESLEVHGRSAEVLPDVTVGHDLGTYVDIAANGTLVYLDPARALAGRTLVWVDRSGGETPIPIQPLPYAYPRVSPDGSRVAVYLRDRFRDRDIWIVELPRHEMRRLTFGSVIDSWPVWTSSTRVAYASFRDGGIANIFEQEVDGRTDARQLTHSRRSLMPSGVDPDGRVLLLSALPTTDGMGWDVQQLALSGGPQGAREGAQPTPVAGLNSRFNERSGVISPNRAWIAFDSDSVGGRFEVFVRPYPNTEEGLWQVSTAGGQQPQWAPNGRELFFLAPDGAMMAAPATTNSRSWDWRPPVELFPNTTYVISGGGNGVRQYDVAENDRFLMVKEAGAVSGATNEIVIEQNWIQDLQRLLPAP